MQIEKINHVSYNNFEHFRIPWFINIDMVCFRNND